MDNNGRHEERRHDSKYRNEQNDHSYNYANNAEEIGKSFVSYKHQNTIDSFWFTIKADIIVNPFDYVTVEQSNYKTIGIIQDLQTIAADPYYTIDDKQSSASTNHKHIRITTSPSNYYYNYQDGINVARVAVMASSLSNIEAPYSTKSSIGMPVGLGKSVRFASAEEVMFALGIPEMAYPIPAGVIEMSNGLQIPVYLDISYIVGPDTAHVNATGISGYSKTSYLLFLLQSTYQKLKEYGEDFALIIFNTKEEDLLHIHAEEEDSKQKKNDKKNLFEVLDLQIEPFNNVTYFLPRGKDGKPNSIHIPENAKTYSYELADVYDRLELLFSEIYDPRFNLSSIINYIYEFWPIKRSSSTIFGKSPRRRKGKQVLIKTWTDLFNFKNYPEEIVTNKSSLLYFQGHIQRFRRSALFIDKKVTSTYLGKEIKQIRSGDVYVVDIAMLSELEQQAFVVGDVMKSIDEMYSARMQTRDYDDDSSSGYNSNKRSKKKPKYLLVFTDEINRFVPKSSGLYKMNTVAEQIMKTVIAGRSRHTILFSAQQFKSAVDYSLQEGTGMHIIAKVGLSELSTTPYNNINKSTKMNIVRLNKGELILVHSAFRYPIKITFPIASFKKP
jgi:uncharacterized protein